MTAVSRSDGTSRESEVPVRGKEPPGRKPLAIGRGDAVADGCVHADDRCERSPALPSPYGALRNGFGDGCVDAEDGCSRAHDGCELAAFAKESANERRIDADARRRFVHDRPLFAIVTKEFSASGRKLVRDG